jgi:FkbM family methyltransferase
MLKAYIKRLAESRGFEIHSFDPNVYRPGHDPFVDMKRRIGESQTAPTIFDVGSNTGQSIEIFRSRFAAPAIHSFEPSTANFELLQSKYSGVERLHLNNFGLGARCETREFIENTRSDMSSFLEPARDCWGEVSARGSKEISTVDAYSAAKEISGIDILKTDTQGFDLEVLKGAAGMIREHRVRCIFTELIFSNMYEHMPRFDELLRFVLDNGFVLISFYEFFYQQERASWSDALFFDPNYRS